jgi:MOSC domain-containing protein YiiM
MEDQQRQWIDKDEFDCDSEYQYSGGKDKAALCNMQQEHYQEIINEDREDRR